MYTNWSKLWTNRLRVGLVSRFDGDKSRHAWPPVFDASSFQTERTVEVTGDFLDLSHELLSIFGSQVQGENNCSSCQRLND
jgi:hypothetical protein